MRVHAMNRRRREESRRDAIRELCIDLREPKSGVIEM
jgi:hypothetical protein